MLVINNTLAHLDYGNLLWLVIKKTLAHLDYGNLLWLVNKEYAGTSGLWELIMARSPDDKIITNGDYDNYGDIMHSTNSFRRNNYKSETKPKANKSWKWRRILKPI